MNGRLRQRTAPVRQRRRTRKRLTHEIDKIGARLDNARRCFLLSFREKIMSTVESDDSESATASASSALANNDETPANSTRTGPTGDAEGGSKVVFLLKAAGGAPILKRRRWTLPRSKTMGHIAEFLKKHMQLDAQQQQQLFLYVNQSFAPALDTTIGSVNDCFSSEGTLVLHYALTQAWG
jgi:ubiquitin-like protein ATG12